MYRVCIILCLLLMAVPGPAAGAGTADVGAVNFDPAEDDPFSGPCETMAIPRELAVAIARQESDLDPWTINVAGVDFHPQSLVEAEALIRKAQAANKSFDVGLMQINSYWHKKWQLDPVRLLEPEFNVGIGLLILQEEVERHGVTWQAIGAYHSPDRERGRRYAWRVYRHLVGVNHAKTGKKAPAPRQAAWHHPARQSDRGGVWRNHGVQRKGRLVTFGVREESLSGEEDREPSGSAGAHGVAQAQR